MRNKQTLLTISVENLFGYPNFMPSSWRYYSRKAAVEPIVVKDGYHDFVLMTTAEYELLRAAAEAAHA